MRNIIIVALLLALVVGISGCGCGGETGGGGDGNVDYGGENPNMGKIISNESTDPNALKPAKSGDLVGEMKIPPHPVEVWTLYAFNKLEVAGERYLGWTEVPLTKELMDKGEFKTFSYDKNKEVTFKTIGIKTEKGNSSDATPLKASDEEYVKALGGTVDGNGEFKHTQSLVKGVWITYTFKKNGADWKGKILSYALKGQRVSETEFGPGTHLRIVAEGPAAGFDKAMEDTLGYMFQQVMITQVAE